MRDILEYGEDDDLEDEIPDEDDEIRRLILEAESNEVWLEEPGDEEDEAQLPMNPLFGMFAAAGGAFPGIRPDNPENDPANKTDNAEKEQNDEDPEH